MSYNGWKNYATWGVALILDNDEGLYRRPVEMAREAVKVADATEPMGDWDKPETRARVNLADALKDWISEWVEGEAKRGSEMLQQILGAGLAEVDWHELAEHYLDLAKESA